MSTNDRATKTLQLINWILSDKCLFPLQRRIEELGKAVRLLDTFTQNIIVVDGSEHIRELIFSIVCKMIIGQRHQSLTNAQRTTLESYTKTTLKFFRLMINLCFPKVWASLIPRVAAFLIRTPENLSCEEAAVRSILVIFKSIEYRIKDKEHQQLRDAIVKAVHPHLLPVLVRLTSKNEHDAQELAIIRMILRTFIASNRIKLSKHDHAWENMEQWLACARRVIVSPPPIPLPQGAIEAKNPMASRVISRAYECFFFVFRHTQMLPKEKCIDYFSTIIKHAVPFLRAHIGRPNARDPVASIFSFLSAHHREFKALIAPYVSTILSQCLYPALLMNAQYRADDNPDWDELFYDPTLLCHQPQIDSLIRQLTSAHSAVRMPFVRLLVNEFKQCATHLQDRPGEHGAAMRFEAAMRAFSNCHEFLLRSPSCAASLRECFTTYFLPYLREGSPLVQASIIRMLHYFADIFPSSEDAQACLATALLKISNGEANAPFINNTLVLIDTLSSRQLCTSLINNAFAEIMRVALESLNGPNNENAATLINTLADQEIYLDRMIPHLSAFITIMYHSVVELKNKENDFDSDLGFYFHSLLESISKLIVAYQYTVEAGTVPQWMDSLRRLLQALLTNDLIDLRASALLLLNCLVCIDINPNAVTFNLVVHYIRESKTEYFNESQKVFRNFYSLGISDEQRFAATDVILRVTHDCLKEHAKAVDCLFFLAWLLNKSVVVSQRLRLCLSVVCRNIRADTAYSNATCAFIAAIICYAPMNREFHKGIEAKWSRADFLKAWLECPAVKNSSAILAHKTLSALAACCAIFSSDTRSLAYIKAAGRYLVEHLDKIRTRQQQKESAVGDDDWAQDPTPEDVDEGDGEDDPDFIVAVQNADDYEQGDDDDSDSEAWSDADKDVDGEELFKTALNALG